MTPPPRTFGVSAWARRTITAICLAIVAASAMPLVSGHAAPVMAGTSNPIVAENAQPGTMDWQYWKQGLARANDVANQVKGYASATSVTVGNVMTLHVTVSPAGPYEVQIYRMGWYGGTGGRLLATHQISDGITQSPCSMDMGPASGNTGLLQCDWAAGGDAFTIPSSWTTGIYYALLVNDGFANYVPFVVRDDARAADLLYQQSVTTYQAYNNYPNDRPAPGSLPATGKSLYPSQSSAAVTVSGTGRAVKVSFDRPYADNGAGQYFEWEAYFVRWMERNGYDVSYSTDLDTHQNGARLLDFQGFLSVGHDEYWSRPMYDAAVAARDRGVDLAFFGANDIYWQVRFEASDAAVADRVMVAYKDAAIDQTSNANLTTVRWRDPVLHRPEQGLIGVQFAEVIQGGGAGPYAAYRIKNAGHWVYEGSGASVDDLVPGIVGYEVDALDPQFPQPGGLSWTMLSKSLYTSDSNNTEYAMSSIYQAPSGAWVFAAGTIGWSWGLDDWAEHTVADARIRTATGNILDRFVIRDITPPVVTPPIERFRVGDQVSLSRIPLRLSWGATDDLTSISRYELQRSTDGGPWVAVPLPSGVTTSITIGLAAGHTYSFRDRATDGAGNASDWQPGTPFTLGARQDQSAAIQYAGTWTKRQETLAFGGTLRASSETGATATFTFMGDSVAWIAKRSPSMGRALVSIDGEPSVIVDLHATSTKQRTLVLRRSWAVVGEHFITVVVEGTSAHPLVTVDAFAFTR